jgi:hypothetical protein
MSETTQNRLTKKQSYWLEQIKKAQASELSISSYAKANQLNSQQLYQYQHLLRKKGLLPVKDKNPCFQKVVFPKPKSHSLAQPGMVNLYFPNGLRLEFSSAISANIITSLVSQINFIDAAS